MQVLLSGLELCAEVLLPFLPVQRVQDWLNVDDVVASRVEGNYVKLALVAAVIFKTDPQIFAH